jgi:hypothetical protein
MEVEKAMPRTVVIEDHEIYLADPPPVPPNPFIGRKNELALCKAAWGVDPKRNELKTEGVYPLHFRLHGAPGLGKNEIVYELARQLRRPLYILQGHEELTPEDLVLLLVPDATNAHSNSMPLVLRASPLASAIYEGALFFFDEINRVPERALSPLSSVLDGRQYIYSAMTGLSIHPKDEEARETFRFCCALNPSLSQAGHVLPDYIEQRTLPVIQIDYPPFEDLKEILQKTLKCSKAFLDAFKELYEEEKKLELSIRQAIALISYAMRYKEEIGRTEPEKSILERLLPNIRGNL